jgi:hypothetical protein
MTKPVNFKALDTFLKRQEAKRDEKREQAAKAGEISNSTSSSGS